MSQKEIFILFIEDEPEILESATLYLTEMGYKIHSSDTAQDAINKLRNQKYDIVILDYKLKKGTGEDVLSKMRMPKQINEETPVIVCSGLLDKELVARIGKLVQAALVKPYNLEQLEQLIKKILKL